MLWNTHYCIKRCFLWCFSYKITFFSFLFTSANTFGVRHRPKALTQCHRASVYPSIFNLVAAHSCTNAQLWGKLLQALQHIGHSVITAEMSICIWKQVAQYCKCKAVHLHFCCCLEYFFMINLNLYVLIVIIWNFFKHRSFFSFCLVHYRICRKLQ